MTRLISAALILLSLSACTKDEPTQDSSVEELPTWSEMSDAQKQTYMATDVTPVMQAIFQEHDPEEYADFGCATCHGSNAEATGYAMPSDIHQLSVPQPAPSEGPAVAFMTDTVLPEMAELLEMEVDDGNNGGFGCYGCHTPAE